MSLHLVPRTAFAFLLAICVSSAYADPSEDKGKPKHQGDVTVALVQPTITQEEVRRIVVAEQKTGYRRLPPGIVKNLARGKPLPKGLQKSKVPATIVQQLPAYPEYEWRRYGADLVLVQIATQVIAEIFSEVFR